MLPTESNYSSKRTVSEIFLLLSEHLFAVRIHSRTQTAAALTWTIRTANSTAVCHKSDPGPQKPVGVLLTHLPSAACAAVVLRARQTVKIGSLGLAERGRQGCARWGRASTRGRAAAMVSAPRQRPQCHRLRRACWRFGA